MSVAARGHARLLQLRSTRDAEGARGVGAGDASQNVLPRKTSELETLRRREKALAAKNRQLADALDASTRATSRREAAVRESKALAANADAQLRAALERARLGVPPRLRTAARGGARAFRQTGGTTAPGVAFDARVFEPSTLREAATRFIGVAGASSSTKNFFRLGGRSSSKRHRAASVSDVSSPRNKNKLARQPDDFLERMRLREEQTRKRREARASEWRSRALAAGGTTAKPGWDDSPDVVVRVGASPEENRRREREREAERALLAARREALLEQMSAQRTSPGSPAVGVEAIMSGMGFAKANKASEGKPGAKSPGSGGTGGGRRRKSLSPAAERQREADARRAAGLDPKFTRVVFGKPSFSASARKKSPKSDRTRATGAPSRVSSSPLAKDEDLRRAATRMLDTPEGRASLRASGFDLDGSLRRSAAAQTGASLAATSSPSLQTSAALFATRSPARRVVEAAGGDPRREIDAMRAILDEVVAHLRVLHAAAEGDADKKSVPPSAEASFASERGPYALDSVDRNKALDMLRAVEAREMAMRRKWGLRGADRVPFSPSGSAPTSYARGSGDSVPSAHADVVARARASIAEIEADTAHVSRRVSFDVSSLRDAKTSVVESAVDADAVARVWEARSRYVAWRAAVDDAVPSTEGDAFDPSEVNEEVAERLLDGLLADVAAELSGACDDATAAVLRQEFTSSAERESPRSPSDEHALFGLGGYDAGSNLIDDDVVGAAVERAYIRGGGWKPDE